MKNKLKSETCWIISILIGGIIFSVGINENFLFIIGLLWTTISTIGLATNVEKLKNK